MKDSLYCELAGFCGGCPWIKMPLEEQRREKVGAMCRFLAAEGVGVPEAVPILDLGNGAVRDRIDLTIRKQDGSMVCGFFRLDGVGREVIPIGHCPMATDALNRWIQVFSKNLPDIKVGSVRLRVAPNGTRGAWLDFANEDVRDLLADQKWLRWLLSEAIVEVGQRKKRLSDKSGILKLDEPTLYPWFVTSVNGETTPMLSLIGGFTQPGFKANHKLVDLIIEKASKTDISAWLELGAGAGNFTLPLVAAGNDVIAVENDRAALAALEANLGKSGSARSGRFLIKQGNFQDQASALIEMMDGKRGLLVDPPRSGLKDTATQLTHLDRNRKPPAILYVSCYPESFARDAGVLLAGGYRLSELVCVDQFPQSPHSEWVGLFSLA